MSENLTNLHYFSIIACFYATFNTFITVKKLQNFCFTAWKDLHKKENIGVCVDTCHINDAGYEVSRFDEYLDEFDKKIGLEKIKVIHLNDSKNPLGAHKDRHENIGYGYVGFENLLNVA